MINLKNLKQTLSDNHLEVFARLNMNYEDFGDNVYCTCPAHEDSDNPRAFSYSVDKQIWKCWTKDCQSHYNNDIFGLIRGALSKQRGEEVDFSAVLQWATSNFKCDTTQAPPAVEDSDFVKTVKIIKRKEYTHNSKPIEIDQYDIPSEYFISRGFTKQTLSYFEIGDYYSKGTLNERSIIPIYNDDGSSLIGVTARAIKEYRMPKYLIYPKGFDKNAYFYNYHRAINSIRKTSTVFLTEGQGDVWKLYEAGVQNAVGLFGKTLSDKQEAKLNQMGVTHVVALLDNDQAGREAKVKIQRQLGRMYTMIFPKMIKKDIGDMTLQEIKDTILCNLKGMY